MIRGLYTAISGMITQEGRQDVITNNLANVGTVGFKEDTMSIKGFDEVLLENYDKIVGGKNVRNPIGGLSQGSKIDAVSTNFTQGTIQQTDKPTDFAIEGRGFFVVQRNDGVNNGQYYTRDGHFHVNMRGILVNDEGAEVLGRNLNNNAIEPINVGNNSFVCDPQGNVTINGNRAYKMYTVDFDNYNSLTKAGGNLYRGTGARESNATVRQNSLEKSNVNLINAMTNMITTMRTFESNQKSVQTMDETLSKLVNDVGNVR